MSGDMREEVGKNIGGSLGGVWGGDGRPLKLLL
jgi:hypothetical protein